MKAIKFILITLLIASLGAFVGNFLAQSQFLEGIIPGKEELSAWYFLYFLFSIFLAILLHELGHLVAGLAQGFSFEYFTVGFLGIKRDENRKVKFFFNKDLNNFGGVAATVPQKLEPDTLDKFAKTIIAGPISSILCGLIAMIWLFFAAQPLTFILFSTSTMCFVIFLAVTLPSRTGMFYTDRKRYQRLRSKGLEKDIEWAFIQTSIIKSKNEPISQMDPKELELLTQDAAPVFQYVGYYYLLDYYKRDSSKVASLKEEMAQIEKDLPKSVVSAFHKEIDKLLGGEHVIEI